MTGLHAESHGIIANNFWDPHSQLEFHYNQISSAWNPNFWLGEPIWETANKAGIITANLMWPGPPKTRSGVSPTYFVPWKDKVPLSVKLDQLLGWIDLPFDERPQLLMGYEPSLDQAGHLAGPMSTLVNKTLAQVDFFAASLHDALANRNLTEIVDIVFVSDHGMTDTSHPTLIYVDDDDMLGEVGLSAVVHQDGWPAMGLRFNSKPNESFYLDRLLTSKHPHAEGFDVYTKDNMPRQWHFAHHERIAPVWLVPKVGYALTTRKEGDVGMNKGNHGYDNREPSMHAMFVAHGPFSTVVKDLHRSSELNRWLPWKNMGWHSTSDDTYVMDSFLNVEIYGLIAKLLGMEEMASNNNGTKAFWDKIMFHNGSWWGTSLGMPPEPKAKLKRRSSRKEVEEYKFDGGHARELELKRSRGEVRRSSINGTVLTIIMGSIGSLATGQGTRFVLAATEHLHHRIARLSGRIRELEDALANLHNKYAPDDQQPHPLLESDWLVEADEGADDDELEPGSHRGRKIKKLPSDIHGRLVNLGGPSVDRIMDDDESSRVKKLRERRDAAPGGDVIDAFGTLSISNHGISRFFGPTGGSESLLVHNLHSDDPSHNQLRNSASPNMRESTSLSPSSSHPSQATTSTNANSLFVGTAISSGGSSNFDPRITLFSHRFPFTPLALPLSQIQELIESYLPTFERAQELVNVYFEQLAWLFRGVTREQLDGEMMGAMYSRKFARDRGENTRDDTEPDDRFVKISQNSRGGQAGGSSLKSGADDEFRPHPSSLTGSSPQSRGEYSGPHDLALLFMVFALGALVEPFPGNSSSESPPTVSSPSNAPSPRSSPSVSVSWPSPSAVGEHYHQLAQAAVSLQPVLEKPSIVTIQCLHLMSIFNAMSGEGTANPSSTDSDSGTPGVESKTGQGETTMEVTWSLITMAAHLSQTIGLLWKPDRDSERWGLSPKMVQRRRILFWDLFVADVWQSLNTGRPPSFSLAYIDCKFPQYEGVNAKNNSSESAAFERGEKSKREGYAFEIWQFRFAAECVAEVISRTLTAEAPTYTTIMELDKKVREFPLPEGFTNRGAGSSAKDAGLGGIPSTLPARLNQSDLSMAEPEGKDPSDMTFSFMKCVLDHIRETAIIEQPTNPLKSVYAPSFLAAYRASATILKSIREQFVVWPNSCARYWTMWTFAFSAAVVFGTVVTRGPRSPLAASAMTELDQAFILFSKAAIYSKRATKALPILTTLREKARHALAAAKTKSPEQPLSDGELWNIKKEELDPNDELSIFAGHTRLVNRAGAVTSSSDLALASAAGFALNHVPTSQVHLSGLRTRRSTSQLRRQYTDVDMETFEAGPRHASQSYSHHLQNPAPPPRPLQRRLSSSFSNVGRAADEWYGEARHYDGYHMHSHSSHPPTISIPPAPVPASMEESSPSHPSMQYNYSYDRSSRGGPSPVAANTYGWSSHEPPSPYPPRHSSSPHPTYSGSGVAGFDPHPMHPPGHPALADLGLASRDSRLDERWSSFMQDSGLLDDVHFGRGPR
ncbi:hypothetical protein D9757_007065 [Collybiopsis confluens]|uniref:Xylanolytic transcriptional activator regulatory domain-containing protein n=1 Tax=Collybiopsis confluens TaxID=2823264 RepID=A0A8H5HC94_9AGAR|nr:hypothetical protein D9757_007065 [Collybiopsis confluens]